MRKGNKIATLALFSFLLLELTLLLGLIFQHGNFALFNPQGVISASEKNLFLTAVFLAAIVVLPTFAVTAWIVWKFRAGNSHTTRKDSKQKPGLIIFWWSVPSVIVLILATITWQATHNLDPFKPITASEKTMTIQVVALEWKWLFIYPAENIASVNYVQFPANVPVDFELTADQAPMNSFWIPQLGGQMYAMSGMQTHLNLMANSTGEFSGRAAELSGPGFAGMTFVAKATSQSDFQTWVQVVKNTAATLDPNEYQKLLSPSENTPETFYNMGKTDLFAEIIAKYSSMGTNQAMPGMGEMKN